MENEIKIFENQNVKLEVNMKDETVWLSLDQMSKSNPKEKDVIIDLVMNFLKND